MRKLVCQRCLEFIRIFFKKTNVEIDTVLVYIGAPERRPHSSIESNSNSHIAIKFLRKKRRKFS